MHVTQSSIDLLTMLQWPRVGPAKVRESVGMMSDSSLIEIGRQATPTVTDQAHQLAEEEARTILDQCEVNQIRVVCILDPDYPERLKGIPDPPPIIYVRGSISVLSQPCIAVVGTRKISQSGSRIARTVARQVSALDFVVVSGLALGVDTLAHEGALDQSGLTVAVLGTVWIQFPQPRTVDLATASLSTEGL